jgi:hypothetical protein
MYKLYKNSNNLEDSVIRLSDNASIPFDPDNTDYQAFLLWKSEGNVPTPADEGVTP